MHGLGIPLETVAPVGLYNRPTSLVLRLEYSGGFGGHAFARSWGSAAIKREVVYRHTPFDFTALG